MQPRRVNIVTCQSRGHDVIDTCAVANARSEINGHWCFKLIALTFKLCEHVATAGSIPEPPNDSMTMLYSRSRDIVALVPPTIFRTRWLVMLNVASPLLVFVARALSA